MAYVHFDKLLAPCGFLIVDENQSHVILIQSDWDWPGVASCMGWVACSCGETDGTVDCSHHTHGDMIWSAMEWIGEHAGVEYPELDNYLEECEQ